MTLDEAGAKFGGTKNADGTWLVRAGALRYELVSVLDGVIHGVFNGDEHRTWNSDGASRGEAYNLTPVAPKPEQKTEKWVEMLKSGEFVLVQEKEALSWRECYWQESGRTFDLPIREEKCETCGRAKP